MPANPLRDRRHPATLLALTIALAGGAAFNWLGSPLPWLIGPLLCCAAANLASGRLHSPRTIRKAGQWVIGKVLGHQSPQSSAPYARVGVTAQRQWISSTVGTMLTADSTAPGRTKATSAAHTR